MTVIQPVANGTHVQQSLGKGTKQAINADFDTFLRMLTVQLQNQDPLNPIDSADYAVQLATFSQVEQQTRTNQLLEAMQVSGASGLGQLAGWVGMEAQTAGPAWLDGRVIALYAPSVPGADRAVLTVQDSFGKLVTRDSVAVGAGQWDWVPADSTGAPLPIGQYSLTLESYAGETLLGKSPVESFGRIVEVRSGADGAKLVLAGGVEVDPSAVIALREGSG